MSNQERTPENGQHHDLLVGIARNADERVGYLNTQSRFAKGIRDKRFPEGVATAIRRRLIVIIKSEFNCDLKAIWNAREQHQVHTGKAQPEIEFENRLALRTEAGFQAEHDFLVATGNLVGITRKALQEVTSLDKKLHFSRTKKIIADASAALLAIKNETTGYTPVAEKSGRERKIIRPGESLDHNHSIEFIANALQMNLAHTTELVEAMESAVAEAMAGSTNEIVRTSDRLAWVRAFVDQIIALLITLKIMAPEKTIVPENQTEEVPEPMRKTMKVMELSHKALAVLLSELEKDPVLFVTQHMARLQDLASSSRQA